MNIIQTPVNTQVTRGDAAEKPVPGPGLAELEARIASAKARQVATEQAKKAAADDPAVKLAEAKLAAAREERAAELAEHELRTDAVYRDACLERGEERVARIVTRDGSIVIRAETELEHDRRVRLMGAHERAAESAPSADERARHAANVEEEARIGFSKLVLSDMAHFNRVTAKYQLWGAVGRAVVMLSDGRVLAEGKGGGA